jgi:hypothetical protein
MRILTLAALASTGRVSEQQQLLSKPAVVKFRVSDANSTGSGAPTPLVGVEVPVASSSQTTILDVVRLITSRLKSEGLHIDRESLTADGSVLLQFLSDQERCVDIYPNGDIVVVVRNGETDEVYELRLPDLGMIVALLKDGRVRA